MKYKRILLKLSGEVLSGDKGTGIDFDKTLEFAREIKEGVELAVEEINAAGGVNVDGEMKKLELVDFINDEADAKKSAAALTSLISKDVDVVVGAVTSGATDVAAAAKFIAKDFKNRYYYIWNRKCPKNGKKA